MRAAGANAYRLTLDWASVAPVKHPKGFREANPRDKAYKWSGFDAQLREVVQAGFEPVVAIYDAPSWARRSGYGASTIPKLQDWSAFVRAAIKRYNGSTRGVPRIRSWLVWLEPNLTPTLSPQLVDGQPVAAIAYRGMVLAVDRAVASLAPGDRVVVGGTAPFRDVTASVLSQNPDWGPLAFTRALFCLSPSLKSTCRQQLRVDVWAINPYTSGDPTHRAELPNDLSLGDLPKLKRVLAAAAATGALVAPHGLELWATEFSWDSKPPDPGGVPTRLLDRWIPQALYQLWRNGFSLVTWLSLADEPLRTSAYQSGFYYDASSVAGQRPKPFLTGFRFPFVALRAGNKITLWGRTPSSSAGTVVVSHLAPGKAPRVVARLRANKAGIFQGTLTSPLARGSMQATVDGQSSLPFGLAPVPDHFYNPFGGKTFLEKPPASGARK